MEDTLQPETVEPIKVNRNLIVGIAASVILHVATALFLIGLPSGVQTPSPTVTYVDLNAAQRPAPMTVPPKQTATLQPLPEQQKPVIPEPQPQVQPTQAAPSQPTPAQEVKVEEQRSRTIMGLGLTKGYFKSLGEGETLRVGIKEYYLEMLQAINEKWWIDDKIDKRRLSPIVVNLTIARNGEIINCKIEAGSGDIRYDKAVLAALEKAGPLPPLPAEFPGNVFMAPIRLVPPLNLMAW